MSTKKWPFKSADLVKRPKYQEFKAYCSQLIAYKSELEQVIEKAAETMGSLKSFLCPDTRYTLVHHKQHIRERYYVSERTNQFYLNLTDDVRSILVQPERVVAEDLHLPQLIILCTAIGAMEDFELVMLSQSKLNNGKSQPIAPLAKAVLKARHIPVENIPVAPACGDMWLETASDGDRTPYLFLGTTNWSKYAKGDEYMYTNGASSYFYHDYDGVPETEDYAPHNFVADVLNGKLVRVTDPAEKSRLISDMRAELSKTLSKGDSGSRSYTSEDKAKIKKTFQMFVNNPQMLAESYKREVSQ